MLGYQFYHSSTRKMVVAIGTLFNNIYLNRIRTGVCDVDMSPNNIVTRPNQDKITTRDIGKIIHIKSRNCSFVTKISNVLSNNQINLEDTPNFSQDSCEYRIIENTIKVPCSYSPREKFLRRYEEQRDFNDIKTQITLPRIGFELVDLRYDSDRMLNKLNMIRQKNGCDPNEIQSQFQRVPYNFTFRVYVQTRYLDDMYQILEQVLAFFTPEFVVTINDTDDMKIKTNVPFVLQNVTQEDTYEGQIEDMRYIISTLTINGKGFLYGPTKSSTRGIIKKAIIQFFDGNWDCNDLSEANKVAVTTVEPSKIEFHDPVMFTTDDDLILYLDLNGNPATDGRTLEVREIDTVNNIVIVKGSDVFLPGETLIGSISGHTNVVKDFSEEINLEVFNELP